MTLTAMETFIIICLATIATMITRFLPFILLKNPKSSDSYISYLGRVLPYSTIGLLVVYCLKDVNFRIPSYGLPEIIAILSIALLHYWKENTLLSIGAGTAIYMLLVQLVFV